MIFVRQDLDRGVAVHQGFEAIRQPRRRLMVVRSPQEQHGAIDRLRVFRIVFSDDAHEDRAERTGSQVIGGPERTGVPVNWSRTGQRAEHAKRLAQRANR